MMTVERYSLISVIFNDLRRDGKWSMILLFSVLVSAILVVKITHQTRRFIAKREQIMLERNSLDVEWRNLLLEKNVLGDLSRIEFFAMDKLKMRHIDPSQANIVVKPGSLN